MKHVWVSNTTLARALALAVVAALGPASANAGTLQLDPQHTSVAFRVRHLFTKVNGQFRKFQGSFQFDEASLRLSEVNAAIDVASVDTNVEARDNDLRSKRFFDAEKYPQMTFKSSAPLTLNGNQGQLQGLLTIHGVEKEVVLEVEYLGKAKDPWGNLRYGFHAATTINRKDFGMKWNEILETGGVLVGDEVEVVLDIEAVPAT